MEYRKQGNGRIRLVLPGYIVLMIFIASCTGRNEAIVEDAKVFDINEFEHIHLVGGKRLDLDPRLRISRFITVDSILIASGKSAANDFGMHIYCLKTGDHVLSFAPIGRGPDENMAVMDFQLLPESRELFFFDILTRVARLYSLDSLLTRQNPRPHESFSFRDSIFDPQIRLTNDHYLCRITLFKPTGSNREMFSKIAYPTYNSLARITFPNLESTPSEIWHDQLWNIFSIKHSYCHINELLVICYLWMDLLEVYDKNLNRLIRQQGPDQFLPVYSFTGPERGSGEYIEGQMASQSKPRSPLDNVVRPTGVARIGYEFCVATETGFYASYNGRVYNPGQGSNLPENIFFFHYDGNPVYRFTFDLGSINLFSVNQKERKIIVTNSLGDLFVYDLPACDL